ncbi:hypothetical protein BRCH_00812c [Candidatus Burkholderia brachyanthoides]|nr:hypothetical protein BRCH_00812c [Candidatus Burkholderia brachyanthoides]
MYRWRTILGWDAGAVANRLGVTPRTVGLWETGEQAMPEPRWRLWIHEVLAELYRGSELIVVLADDGQTPVDVVSDASYAGLAQQDGEPYALIASYAIDRVRRSRRCIGSDFSAS